MKRLTLLLSQQNLMTIRWPLLTLLGSLCLSAAAYAWLETLQDKSHNALQRAQQNLQETRQSIAELEAELEAFNRYQAHYEQLEARALLSGEDRIGLLEEVARIRAQYHLFPINVSIGQQAMIALHYPPGDAYPGGPVNLHYSQIDLSLPLLHEEDLLNLLSSLHDSKHLFQTQNYSLQRSTGREHRFDRLGPHFTADCSLLWYTFALPNSPASTSR